MSKSVLSAPHFHDEAAAFAYVEARVWPTGCFCPHCGGEGVALPGVRGKAKKDKEGKVITPGAVRIGLKRCAACHVQFTVRVKTIFESSHVPLHLWLQAMFLLASSKKGISSNQLSRTLGVTLKTAWFMSHRIRLAMQDGTAGMFGAGGGGVEADETFIGREPGQKVRPGPGHKMKVVTLVDRDTKQARSTVVDVLSSETVGQIVRENVSREARLLTDESRLYRKVGQEFAAHSSVNHFAHEYVSKADPTIHTNTVEGFFSVFKRGMRGVYQHCAKAHLHRYTTEFDFRYSNRVRLGVDDQARFALVVNGIVGKRLTYQTVGRQGAAA
ncbi:MAG: IS1595 family transposase [Hyphomonadaceae bacterium]|nr:MAG: transposase [Caulobacteraceae bacterium]MBT9447751.1 IS1595 family transposase [Hyphomonadaceae bacterium]TPW02719.1 MAG: transposase [Alphaproteobacteria bacterium]